MATAPDGDGSSDLVDQCLARRGHEVARVGWERDYNKKQCPECRGLHDMSAHECSVCGWRPDR